MSVYKNLEQMVNQPIRVQRKRTKGFKLPENTICVTRGTNFGNPFKIGELYKIDFANAVISTRSALHFMNDGELIFVKDAAHAVQLFERFIALHPFSGDNLKYLHGKNLACFCPLDKPCHADFLLGLADA